MIDGDSSGPAEGRLSARSATLVLVVGLLLSIAYLAVRGSLYFDVSDPNRYLRFAFDLLHHGAYSAATQEPFVFSAMRPPGYPLFLLPFVALPEPALFFGVLIGHVALVAASGFFVYRTTRSLTGSSSTAALSLALFGSHLELLMISLAPLEHAFFTFLVCAMVYVRFASPMRPRPVLLGVLAGLAYLTRPTGLLTAAVVLFDSWTRRDEPADGRANGRLRRTATLALVMLLVALPWQLVLQARLGTWAVFPSTTNGLNLYKGNNADFATYYPYVDVDAADGVIAQAARERLGASAEDEVAVDRYLRREGLRYALSHPAETARAVPWKLAYLYSPMPTPLARGVLVGELGELELRELRWPGKAAWLARTVRSIPVVVLYLGCFFFVRRYRACGPEAKRYALFVFATFVLLTFAHIMTFAETRYRLAFDPLLCVLASVGFSRVREGVPS